MRIIACLLFSSLNCFVSNAQIAKNAQNTAKGVFVMVDLSINLREDPNPISPKLRQEAIKFTRALITAEFKNDDFPDWQQAGIDPDLEIKNLIQGKSKPLLEADDYFMIMPFGELETSKNFKINLIQRYPADFNNYYEFPFQYVDMDTWGDYAEAKASKIAQQNSIASYYLFRIQGRPDDPNSYILDTPNQEMVDLYITGSTDKVLARFKHKASQFSITIKKIDISKLPGLKKLKTIKVKPKNIDKKSLQIISPKGTTKNPFKTTATTVTVNWNCLGCDSLPKFTLKTTNLDTKKSKPYMVKKQTVKSITLEPGKYKINVSAKGVRSKAQYLEIEEESSGGIGFLITILLLGTAVYFAVNYFKKQKKTAPDVEYDDFDSGSGNFNNDTNDDWS